MLDRWWIGPILVLYTSQTEKVKNDRFYLKVLTFSSHILRLTFFWLFISKMLTLGWLFLTFFLLTEVMKKSDDVYLKSQKVRKSPKILPENLKNMTCFFDIIWQVLLSFRKTKNIYKYKTVYRFSSVAYSNYKETLQLILATYMNTWYFFDFLELFLNVIFYF